MAKVTQRIRLHTWHLTIQTSDFRIPHSRKRGQAMVELAVFGSLFILVLASLIRFGLSVTYSQELKQEAFRKALKETVGNVSASYTVVEDRMVPSASPGPFALSPRTRVAGSGSVLWDFDLFGSGSPSSPIVIEINNVRLPTFSSDDFDPNDPFSGLQPEVNKEVFVEGELERAENSAESPSGIATVNKLTQTEIITSKIKTVSGTQEIASGPLVRSTTTTTVTPFGD